MDYYLGGYLLLHICPVPHPQNPGYGKRFFTCSTCFNESLLNAWALSWGSDKDTLYYYDANITLYEHLAASLGVDDALRERIHRWADEQFNQTFGWGGVFMNAASAVEYKQTFFPDVDGCCLLALYFSESDAQRFLRHFKDEGIPIMLARKLPEEEHKNEQLLGYNIVGLDFGGEFHTSHCHNLDDELHRRFGLTLNQFGLYDDIPDWQPVIDYMNDETTGCEPVPWGIAKIKQVIF